MKYLWFEVTNKCNSRCSYCNIWREQKPNSRKLTVTQFYDALNDPVFRNVDYIINSGGEPTMEPLLEQFLLAEHFALPNAIIQLSTNALLPQRVLEVAKHLHGKGASLQVGISLDGVGEEHDKIRGVHGNFEKVKFLIPELQKYALVTVGATLTEETLDANLHAYKWAKERNIPFMFHWLNKSSFYSNLNDTHENAKILNAVQLLPPGLYRDKWIESLRGKPVRFNCKALKDFCVLKRNGDVVPCLSMWSASIGNVLDDYPSSLLQKVDRETIRQCRGCLNNWGVCWSLSTFEKYLWWGKRKLRSLVT